MLVRDFLQPATVLDEQATIGDAAAGLLQTGTVYLQTAAGWRAVLPRQVVGYPVSRRLIDVPLTVVTPIDADSDIELVIDPAEPVDVVPVVAGGLIIGCVDRQRVLGAIAAETSPEQLGLLLMTRLTPALLHDVSNTLTVAQVAVQLALRTQPGEDLEAAQLALAQGIDLIRRTRALATGVDEAAPGPVDVTALVAELRPLLAAALGSSIHLALDLAPGVPAALAYRRTLERALLNLAVNARDAIGGHGRLAVSVAASAAGIELRVDDDGPGVEPALARRLFEPGVSTRGAARGLGLAAVAQALHRVGGRIELAPSALGGTCFAIVLPEAVRA